MSPSAPPKVSIIMNCYNGERYLKEAIDSIYAQTYADWEIIFWDNASTDKSAEIAKSYDVRLKYFCSEKTVPLGSARNMAMKKATGELVAFLDTDDLWLPYKLERQISVFEDNRYALSYAGVIHIDKDGQTIGSYVPKYRSGYLLPNLLRQFDINVPTAIVRKSMLEKSNLSFDESIVASEEYCLFMQLAVDHEINVIPSVLAKYRIHDNALTNKAINKWGEEREYTLNLIVNKYPGIEHKFRSDFKEAFARAKYYKARYYEFLGERKRARGELKKILFVNYKYVVALILLYLPNNLWNCFHNKKTNRNIKKSISGF